MKTIIRFNYAAVVMIIAAFATIISCKKEIATSTSNATQDAQAKVQALPPPPADPAIAYNGASGKTSGIMVMNADGSNQTMILAGSYDSPSWSPDGHSILVEGGGTIGGHHLWIIDVSVVSGKPTGSNLRLVPVSGSLNFNGEKWSPLGDSIAFTAENQNVYTVSITGGTPIIAYTSATGLMPFDVGWSPDESKIVFTQWNDAWTQSDVTVVNRISGQVTTVVPLSGPAMIYSPSWSRHADSVPGGGNSYRIAYSAAGLYTVTVDSVTAQATAAPVKITSGSYQTWSPDDSKLALVVSGKPSATISTYAFSGGATQILVSGGRFPDWRRF